MSKDFGGSRHFLPLIIIMIGVAIGGSLFLVSYLFDNLRPPFASSTEVQQQDTEENIEQLEQKASDVARRLDQHTNESMTSLNQMTFVVLTNHGYLREEICENILGQLDSMDGDPAANIRIRFLGIEQECADVIRQYQETR